MLMDILSLITPSVALLLSVYVYRANSRNRKYDRKIDITMRFHTLWNEEIMKESRRVVSSVLNQLEREVEYQGKVKWSEIATSVDSDPDEIVKQFSSLNHFMMDIHSLIKKDMIEISVFQPIVGNTLCRFIERMDHLIDFDESAYLSHHQDTIKSLQLIFNDYPRFYSKSPISG